MKRCARYFEPHPAGLEVKPALRERVQWSFCNLRGDAYPDRAADLCDMDLILCRNVLIYFRPEAIAHADRVSGLVCTKGVIEKSFEMARMKCLGDQQPQQESLNLARRALQENQAQVDKLVETITSGAVSGDLMVMLSEKATALKLERERLRTEHRQLELSLVPMDEYFDTLPLRKTLSNFSALAGEAEPVEMQQLLRCMVRRIEWQPSGEHVVEFYGAKKSEAKKTRGSSEELPLATPNNWLEVERRSDGPGHSNFEPVVLGLSVDRDCIARPESACVIRIT